MIGNDGNRPPAITVLLPVYNAAAFLRTTLDSILAQTFTDFEVLAIDDGSTDGSTDMLRSINDPRLRLVVHAKNRGLIASLNEGIELARGRYIARMDADDVMHPERLAAQIAFLEAHPEISVLGTYVELVNVESEVTGVWDIDRATPDEDAIHAMLPRTNCMAHPSVMIRRSALEGLRYDRRQSGAEDWDLWLRMRSRGHRFAKLERPLLQYRMHPGSIMGTARKQVPYELRLIGARRRFLYGEWLKGRFRGIHLAVLKAQARTAVRYLRSRLVIPVLRKAKRILSYSLLGLWREHRALTRAERNWKGDLVFLLPYLSTGGAEQVHADILAAVADQRPLIVMCGFSRDRAFAVNYAQQGTLLELPRLLNHPFTRQGAERRLAAIINAAKRPVLFSSNTTTFFELLEHIRPDVRTYHLQHAFLHQPTGNVQHGSWLKHVDQVDGYVFISGQARAEFQRFLFVNQVPSSRFNKLLLISNAVHHFGKVTLHERPGLLFVGRPSAEKRLELFLHLADRLERERPGHFRFTVVGSGEVPGHPQVAFNGLVNDPLAMSAIYASHDMLVLTSSREGFPLVIMEAMAQGLLVISTPVGDVPQRLNDQVAIITSDVHASTVEKEMQDAVLGIYADRERMEGMRVAALAFAHREFDPERFRERYRALLIRPAS